MDILKKTTSKNGNEIKLVGTSGLEKVLVIGVFHGEEPQGKFIIDEYLKTHESNLLFISCLNPDGMAGNKRTNANGVDLNRNYPTKNWKLSGRDQYFGGETPASEIETKFVVEVIEEYRPKAIITLHAPYKIVNYDGPAEDLAQKISDIIKYPVEASIGYPTPGSFGTYCGVERKIPTITLELDEECPVEDLLEPVHKVFDMLDNM